MRVRWWLEWGLRFERVLIRAVLWVCWIQVGCRLLCVFLFLIYFFLLVVMVFVKCCSLFIYYWVVFSSFCSNGSIAGVSSFGFV